MTKMQKREQGFTLIEMIVTVAIIASLAAILVPIVSSELGDTAQSRALGDCQRIGTAITQYIKDTRVFPTGPGGDNSVNYLLGVGTEQTTNGMADDGDDAAGDLEDYLTDGATNGGALWAGPYMQQVPVDPWGNPYVVNVHGYFENSEYVWVVSSGPDGDINTSAEDTVLQGDDIGVLID